MYTLPFYYINIVRKYINVLKIIKNYAIIRDSLLLANHLPILQTFQSRHLRTEELRKPDISIACARIMANFHKLNMPMIKQPKWLFEKMNRFVRDRVGVCDNL